MNQLNNLFYPFLCLLDFFVLVNLKNLFSNKGASAYVFFYFYTKANIPLGKQGKPEVSLYLFILLACK